MYDICNEDFVWVVILGGWTVNVILHKVLINEVVSEDKGVYVEVFIYV